MQEFYRFICLLGRPVSVMQGTFGSLVGVLLALLVSYYDSPSHEYLFYTLTILYILGTFCLVMYNPKEDDNDVIIDEVLGQVLSVYLTFMLYDYYIQCDMKSQWFFIFIVLNFVLFRFFDILKPSPINTINSTIQNPLGIILDDVIAAIYAAILSVIILYLLFGCQAYAYAVSSFT